MILLIDFYRRDKEACHECRFCCTLSVCTTQNGTSFYRGFSELLEKENSTNGLSAKSGYESIEHKMWKSSDFRCLKPVEGKESHQWPHYEMNGYRAAKTEQELEKVEEIQFDKYFFNLEDPQVFDAMTDKKKAPKLWKKTYGFDYVTLIEGRNGKANLTKCYMNCLKAEKSKFATKCTNSGGLFKCCLLGYFVFF